MAEKPRADVPEDMAELVAAYEQEFVQNLQADQADVAERENQWFEKSLEYFREQNAGESQPERTAPGSKLPGKGFRKKP